MTGQPTFVVVGAGLAAGKAVETLRGEGFEGRILVYGDEPHRPYERPPLSKEFLVGSAELDSVFVHDEGWYDEHRVELRLGVAVETLDLAGRTITAGGRPERFDSLLLATGASPRRLRIADDSEAPVAYLRTIEDSQRLRRVFGTRARVAIVGGGWIGLEVAAAARAAGCDVTVLETLSLPLLRVLGPEVAERFATLHRDHGVDLRTDVAVAAVDAQNGRAVVHLEDTSVITADLLVVGIGVAPNTALAESAGLLVDNGVVTDELLRSSDPQVFAAGDLANAYHPLLDRRIRVEHWDNAIEQGVTAARNMLGQQVGYERLPYFFTDQYDWGMEYVGHVAADGYDEVVLRGDASVFTAFWLAGGRVVAGMHVNDWDAIEPIRRLVGREEVDLDLLRRNDVPLEELSG